MSRRKQHHLAGSSFSPLCNICMVSNLFAMQWEPRETISHGGIWTIHAALLSFYNHAATPGAICLLLRPCRQCTHMHAISRVQMQVYWTLEPKSFCHYEPKKPPYLHFIWTQIIIPNLLPWTLFMTPILFFLWLSLDSSENISILLDCQLNSSSWQCLNCPIIGAVKTSGTFPDFACSSG